MLPTERARRFTGNRFIDALPAEDAHDLTRLADLRAYPEGVSIARRGEPIESLHFPISGAIVHLEEHAGRSVQVATVGADGVSGFEVLLGVPHAQFGRQTAVPLAAFVADPLKVQTVYERSAAFRALLLRYAVASMRLAGIAAACDRHGLLDARLAAWILALHETSAGGVLRVTHDLAARMLGAQRAGVTHAFAKLTRAGAIARERGRVRVADPNALRAAACACRDEARDVIAGVYDPRRA